MDNTGFRCDQEAIVIAECGNSDMYPLHPICSVIPKAIRVFEKLYLTWSVWFIFLYRSCSKPILSDKYLVSYIQNTCRNASMSAHKVVVETVWSK